MANTFKKYETTSITTETVVLTGPAATQSTIIGLTLANTSGSDVTASVKGTTAFIIKDVPIPTGSSLLVVGGNQKLVVEAGQQIKVISSGTVDCVISSLEIS